MSNAVEQLSEHDSYEKPRAQPNLLVLNERRRAALAEIDNAPFSYVYCFAFLRPISPFSQLVSRQSLFGSRCRLLHRCVSSTFSSP